MPAWRGWSSEGFPSPRPPGPRAKPAAAAAAKLPQSCPTLVRPHRWQPTRLRHPWDSPGKNTGVACHFLLQYMKVRSESEVTQSIRLFPTPWTAAHQALLPMGFSRQEYWTGLPLPSPEQNLRPGQTPQSPPVPAALSSSPDPPLTWGALQNCLLGPRSALLALPPRGSPEEQGCYHLPGVGVALPGTTGMTR